MIVLGTEKTNILIDRMFNDCEIDRGNSEYVDYISDQIFLATDGKLKYLIWYKFTGYLMEWALYRFDGMEMLGSGSYDVSYLL